MTPANFFAVIAANFAREDDASCIIDETGAPRLAYADINVHTAQFAGLLGELGLQHGDRLIAQIDKSPEAVLLYLACLRAGIVFVPLNTAYTANELEYFLRDAEPKLVVCRPENEKALTAMAPATLLTLDSSGGGTLAARAAQSQPDPEIADVDEKDVATMLYTSGTTGRSKGAMLTHGNLASNVEALTKAWGWTSDDVLLHALPIYHAHGLFVGVHLSLFNGTPMIFLPKFTPDDVIKWLPEATVFMGVPTFYMRLLAHRDFHRSVCTNVRLFISGSAPLLTETFDAFEARTGDRILERYGMTEALMITSNPLDGERMAGSVGYPLDGVRARVVGANGERLTAGQVGDLEITGPNVFKGYWRQPEQTAKAFTNDGYFRTGDLALLADDGRVSLVGRSKDLIISGGLNVYPKEVENALDSDDAVLESAVIGVPHPDLGEAVVAVLVPRDSATFDETTVAQSLRAQLAGFKQPKLYVTVDDLPRNAMGKVEKNRLREQYTDYFTA